MLINQRNILRNIKNLLPNNPVFQKEFGSLLIALGWSLNHELRKTNPMVDLYRRVLFLTRLLPVIFVLIEFYCILD